MSRPVSEIATPMVLGDDAIFAVDLWLDVLVRADGVTHGVYDQDEFDRALARGWLSDREARAASNELRSLVELIEACRGRKLLIRDMSCGEVASRSAPRGHLLHASPPPSPNT
jgi:predicted RNA-binding protein associated with RNAse of E/G family